MNDPAATSTPLVAPRSVRLALALAAALFALYPMLRPYSDETSLDGAAAFASTTWSAAHLSAMAALTLLVVALAGMHPFLAAHSSRAVGAVFVGVCMLLPYYGAETFGLHALGSTALARGDAGLVGAAELVRLAPAPAAVFLLGLVALAVGGLLLALAVASSGLRPWWAGWPLAAALVLLLPQFFAPPSLRIAHGLLFAAGCVALLVALPIGGTERSQTPPSRVTAATQGPDEGAASTHP